MQMIVVTAQRRNPAHAAVVKVYYVNAPVPIVLIPKQVNHGLRGFPVVVRPSVNHPAVRVYSFIGNLAGFFVYFNPSG